MTLATLPTMLGTEYLRLLEAKDETGIFDLLAEDAQIVDELTRRWVRGRHPIGAAMRELFTRVTDIHSTAEDVHVMRWGDVQVETFTLHQVYDLDESSVWAVSPTTLVWHRVDHAWKLALMASIATDCA
jgi:ketosteroid isomerase-like protein